MYFTPPFEDNNPNTRYCPSLWIPPWHESSIRFPIVALLTVFMHFLLRSADLYTIQVKEKHMTLGCIVVSSAVGQLNSLLNRVFYQCDPQSELPDKILSSMMTSGIFFQNNSHFSQQCLLNSDTQQHAHFSMCAH